MTYKKTTANERRQQVKLRYLHVSPKGSEPSKGFLSKVVEFFTPSRPPTEPLGKTEDVELPFKLTTGAFGGSPLDTGLGPQGTSGSKVVKLFRKHLQGPRGY
jgi:hypothetical protein